jgi:hypothetical protein
VRLRKNTRAAASTVTRNKTRDQPLYHGVTRHFRRSLDRPKLLTSRSIRFWLPTGHDALFQGYPGALNAGHGAFPIKTTGAKPDFICQIECGVRLSIRPSHARSLRLPRAQYQLGFLGLGGHTGFAGTKPSRFGISIFGRVLASRTSFSWMMPFR